jgi:pantothenate kinase type III
MLYVDIGNSAIKVASKISEITANSAADLLSQTSDDDWHVHLRARHNQISDVFSILESELLAMQPIVACSVVGAVSQDFKNKFGNRVTFISVHDFPEGSVDYDTPDTLGADRVLACFGAHSLAAGLEVIVVDAGTAVTIDLMDRGGVFRGGVIAPGLALLENGLKELAPALPTVPRSEPGNWPPKSTVQAVQWGLTGGYLLAVSGFVDRFKQQYPQALVWITGGDAQVLTQIRSNKLHYHPNLVFEGLHAFMKAYGQ